MAVGDRRSSVHQGIMDQPEAATLSPVPRARWLGGGILGQHTIRRVKLRRGCSAGAPPRRVTLRGLRAARVDTRARRGVSRRCHAGEDERLPEHGEEHVVRVGAGLKSHAFGGQPRVVDHEAIGGEPVDQFAHVHPDDRRQHGDRGVRDRGDD